MVRCSLIISLFAYLFEIIRGEAQTQKVLVGILAQPLSHTLQEKTHHKEEVWSYIAGSYVDYISQTGAMPVLIPFDMKKDDLNYFLDNLDAFLLPGGAADLSDPKNPQKTTEYQDVNHYIIQYIKEKNKKGKYMPLIATCLGFESLMISENENNPNIMTCDLDDQHKNHTVYINEEEYAHSKFFKELDQKSLRSVFGSDITYYTHHCGVFPKVFKANKKISEEYLLIGTSKNDKGVDFVGTVEHKTYPIIGNQWHPEKNQFERGTLYSFLDRSEETTRFLSSIIRRMVQKVRPKAKNDEEIPQAIKPYYSVYRAAEVIPLHSYERIYCFERYERKVSPKRRILNNQEDN